MKRVVTCVLLTALLFGTMETALKIGGSTFDSVQLTFLRFMIGGLILLPMGIKEAHESGYSLTAGDIRWLTLVGAMGIPISMLCFQLGVERCNAATAAALICMNPLFTMVIAHIFTEEKMTSRKALAFAVGIVAGVFLIRPWDVEPGNTIPGIILMLVAAVTFAAYTVMGKRSIARVGTFMQTSVSFILGSLILLVVLVFTGRPILAGITANPLVVLYSGIFVTGLGYLFYFIAIKYSDATTGSLAFFIKPAIAPIFAITILGESIEWNTVVGILFLLTASVITLTGEKNKVAEGAGVQEMETAREVAQEAERGLEREAARDLTAIEAAEEKELAHIEAAEAAARQKHQEHKEHRAQEHQERKERKALRAEKA
ncbi:EamA family transporter [Mobilibacterium timonense]|uniref:DMT family transporter n=1 Tax=Mobilibacterium timonense TaxID=1871012 RepID=UPI003A90E19B